MNNPLPSAPHLHAPDNVPALMRAVLWAVLPATLYGIGLFGWPAFNLLVITVLSSLLGEALCLGLAHKPIQAGLRDSSALMTGVLLALSLPPWAPWWIGVVGGFFAIVVGKQVFGGIGQNLFNPAMLARVMLLVSFPVEMTFWLEPHPLFFSQSPGFLEGLAITFHEIPNVDAVSGATLLGSVRTELGLSHTMSQILADHYHPIADALGTTGGSLGETGALLLAAGGGWLLWKRVITWHIPAALLMTVLLLATVLHLVDPQRFTDPMLHLLSGGLIMGAFFIATDPVTSPTAPLGQIVFGVGCGVLIYVIRTWGGYPEGVAFAVVLMNAMTPVIDHYIRPRIYGRTWSGQPKPVSAKPKEET